MTEVPGLGDVVDAIAKSANTKTRAKAKPRIRWGLAANTLADRAAVFSPGSKLIECIVGDCEWALVLPMVTELHPPSLRLAAALGVGAGTEVVTREKAEWIDEQLGLHLKTHDVVEWAETVRDLEQANAEWEDTCKVLTAEIQRNKDMLMTLSEQLSQARSQAPTPQQVNRSTDRMRAEEIPPDAAFLPAGIGRPYDDPMKEPIVAPGNRAEGQVARRG